MSTRYAKIVMCLCLAAFAFLVTFGNITDYGSNYEFVKHVLSMDSTFPGNSLMYRSISTPVLWNASYILIIAGEGITCILYLAATASLWKARHAPARSFHAAKNYAVMASTIGFLVWFFGFMVIGGEWFAMWQSSTWNGQNPAFRFYVTILLVLIFIMQPDEDLERPTA